MEKIRNLHKVFADGLVMSHDLMTGMFVIADANSKKPGRPPATPVIIDPVRIATSDDAEAFCDMLDDLMTNINANRKKIKRSERPADLYNAKAALQREIDSIK